MIPLNIFSVTIQIILIMRFTNEDWEELFYAIKDKKCTPFIGAGACAPWLPLGKDIARDWASKHNYPLEDSYQLSRVAQFLAIENGNDLYPKNILSRLIKEIQPPDFSLDKNRNTPYSVLADLNLPIYITTNYDHFMEAALKSKGKEPVSEFCRWNNYAEVAGIESKLLKKSKYQPSISQPLVYHLHGDIDIPQSMILTENDYIDFLVTLSKGYEDSVVPPIIRRTFVDTILLFIGYSLEDINFRIIFRNIIDYLGSRFQLRSIAVLLPPQHISTDKIDQAQKYLDQYTKDMFKIQVYWGDALAFASELRERWYRFRNDKNQ
jgi:hypothetical protein